MYANMEGHKLKGKMLDAANDLEMNI